MSDFLNAKSMIENIFILLLIVIEYYINFDEKTSSQNTPGPSSTAPYSNYDLINLRYSLILKHLK